MKSLISLMLIIMLLSFSACGTEKIPENTPQTTENPQQTPENEVIEMSFKDKVLNGLTEDAYDLSLANEGNADRIKALMKKAEQGGSYTIAVLGGSISQGAGATKETNCYGYHVKEWWENAFPNATFKFINGGLGGTNPEMACYRYCNDIEPYKPDFTIIDFTQNTYLDNNLKVTYLTLVHKLLTEGSAVMAAYFTRCNPDEYKKANYIEVPAVKVPHDDIKYVVDRYNLPAVDTDKYIWKYMNKEITWPEIYSDYIHPNDQGHLLCANLIAAHLDKIKTSLDDFDGAISEIPDIEDDSYLNASCLVSGSMGITARGVVKSQVGDKTSSRGWWIEKGEGSLTVLLPENVKKAKLLLDMGRASGCLLLTSFDGTTQKIDAKKAPHATLIDIKLDLTKLITITPQFESGSAMIYYIGIE